LKGLAARRQNNEKSCFSLFKMPLFHRSNKQNPQRKGTKMKSGPFANRTFKTPPMNALQGRGPPQRQKNGLFRAVISRQGELYLVCFM
jgi:hypothetical protein